MPEQLPTAARTDRNDSKDILLLLAYAKKLQEAQQNIDEVCNLMKQSSKQNVQCWTSCE